jgi:hypothetical protein
MIEGSGYGSMRPKNLWIRIRIWNTAGFLSFELLNSFSGSGSWSGSGSGSGIRIRIGDEQPSSYFRVLRNRVSDPNSFHPDSDPAFSCLETFFCVFTWILWCRSGMEKILIWHKHPGFATLD